MGVFELSNLMPPTASPPNPTTSTFNFFFFNQHFTYLKGQGWQYGWDSVGIMLAYP